MNLTGAQTGDQNQIQRLRAICSHVHYILEIGMNLVTESTSEVAWFHDWRELTAKSLMEAFGITKIFTSLLGWQLYSSMYLSNFINLYTLIICAFNFM